MKKFALVTLLAGISSSALAESNGKAFFPGWLSTSAGTQTRFFVTNISDSTSTVTFKLYKHNGSVYDETSESGQNFTFYGSFSGDPTSITGATLGPNMTGAIYVNSSLFNFGYGVIEWTSEGNKQVSFIASGLNDYQNGNQFGRAAISINDGKPF